MAAVPTPPGSPSPGRCTDPGPPRPPIFQVSLKIKRTPKTPNSFGDRTTSDVVVRLRTHEGRDNWFYCHSEILIEKSKYFAERLSDDWPTCQILDSRYCVEVYCEELEFDFHVIAFRLLYVTEPQTRYGVRNTLGIFQVAVRLGCHQLAHDCIDYLESVPWEETEEEEMLRIIPHLGSQYEEILARLQPVNPISVVGVFISTIRFATSSPSTSLRDLKSSAQDQLEYMLTEDDDAPLLTLDNEDIKIEVKNCIRDLLSRFNYHIESLLNASQDMVSEMTMVCDMHSFLSDISWVCQILTKMEMMKHLVHYWLEASLNIVRVTEKLNQDDHMPETRLKVIEVTSKVLDAVGFGHVIVATAMRLGLVNVWLPFVQRTRPLLEQANSDSEGGSSLQIDSEIWQGLESAFISILLTLPSVSQAEILAGWLRSEHARYPDLTEAFEAWCYRSKIAKRRLALSDGISNRTSSQVKLEAAD
ncbi:BTB/POZ domain-containing protein At3g05675-like isoform X1 [Musa acuminata AAA Group]|uniref:BTB/POZ domain-containing protein At3g05675-like isoform X1 n=1 Tax=Musa acuminata AAA Group TaxID=214697 RepID=UPI0031D257BB